MTRRVFHLAQANIALGRVPITDRSMRTFVEQLDYINAVAKRSNGLVWRLQTEDGDGGNPVPRTSRMDQECPA